MTDNKEIADLEELQKKIEECPSERVREAMKESLNKENNTSDKDA